MSARVVIVGAGLAGQRCCEALRARGWEGPILLVGDEEHAPYDRPPLSKGLLAGTTGAGDVALRPPDWHAEHGVELVLGARAVGLVPGCRQVLLAGGRRLRYDRLVVATGGTPRMLPALRGRANVHVLRTLDDALALRAALAPGVRLAVVGAGLVGLEVAATARAVGAAVTVVEAARAPLAAVLGERIGRWLADLHVAAGVEVITGATVEAVHGRARVEAIALAGGRRVACDALLVAVGMVPATGWLAGCGLAAGAIASDAAGRTRLPRVYAAGDACGAGHWEAAARQGATVAATILGVPAPGAAPAAFWSDQHGVRLQFAGTAAGHDRVEIEGHPLAGDACALFHRRGRLVGGLLVGRPRDLPALRRCLQESDLEPERSAA
jgi:3-phenylpropionate/trans-cinnamate dioxygenase ferredoxin reductase component